MTSVAGHGWAVQLRPLPSCLAALAGDTRARRPSSRPGRPARRKALQQRRSRATLRMTQFGRQSGVGCGEVVLGLRGAVERFARRRQKTRPAGGDGLSCATSASYARKALPRSRAAGVANPRMHERDVPVGDATPNPASRQTRRRRSPQLPGESRQPRPGAAAVVACTSPGTAAPLLSPCSGARAGPDSVAQK